MPAPKVSPTLLRSCVADYLLTGNIAEACRRNNLDESTLGRWKERPIWAEIEAEFTAKLATEAKASFNRALTETLKQIEERLATGDVVALRGGQRVSIPVRARDLTLLMSQLFDKLRLIEGKATKITQGDTKVSQLLNEFKQMGQAYRTGQVLDSTSTEVRLEGDGQGSLEGGVEGQKPTHPIRRYPPSAGPPVPPMPPLLQDHRPIQNPVKGRIKKKIAEYGEVDPKG